MPALPGIFQTPRLTFWPFTLGDFDAFRTLDTDPDVMRYLGPGRPRTEAESKESFDRVLSQTKQFGVGLYAAHLRGNGNFVGRAGLIQWEIDGEKLWEVGYTFAKDYWGKGLATEAAKFWAEKGFEILGVPFLVSLIHPENKASIHVAEKNGMTFWKSAKVRDKEISVYRRSKPK